MKNQTLEQKSREVIVECKWCGEKYNLKQRQEEVRKQESERGVTTPNRAPDYCTNQCWIKADETNSSY